MRMSAAHATSRPPPTHAPWISATTGWRQAAKACIAPAMRSPYFLACFELERSSLNAAMSAPAANALSPAPRITMQRSESSLPSLRAWAPSCSHIASDSAFRRSGLESTSVATSPSRERRTSPLMPPSLDLDACVLDELGVLRYLGLHEGLELRRALLVELRADRFQALAHIRHLHGLVDVGVQLGHDLARRAGRRHHAVPVGDVEALDALFVEGRHVGQLRQALR